MLLQQSHERLTGELAALIRVEDLRLAVAVNRLLHRLQAEVCGHGDLQSPGQYAPGVPVDHGRQIHKAPRHWNLRDIHCPELVRTVDTPGA